MVSYWATPAKSSSLFGTGWLTAPNACFLAALLAERVAWREATMGLMQTGRASSLGSHENCCQTALT